MRKKIISIALLSFFFAGLTAQGDSLWSLDRCIDQAIQYNLDVKRQELMLQSASQDVRQSKMDLLPNLNGALEHQLGEGRVLDRGDYTWKDASVSQGDLGMRSDLTLFNGLQGFNKMKMSRASYHMNLENLDAMEDNLTINVMTYYLNLLRNKRLVEVGNEPKGRLLEVKAQQSAAELTLTQAINTSEIARLDLMHLMNITDQREFDIEKPLFPEPSMSDIPSLDSVFGYAVANLPQIKSAQFGIETQERNLAIQRGQRSPRLYASGLYYSNYSDGLENPDPTSPTTEYPITEQITNNQYKQVSMGIQIPFFNRWQVQTRINKAKISLQDAEYQYDNAVLELQKSIQQYHTEALAALDNYKSAQEAVANSDEVYRFAEERFKVGTGTALEMQEARRQLFESTAEMISSRYVLIFYSKILDFYMGKEIVF